MEIIGMKGTYLVKKVDSEANNLVLGSKSGETFMLMIKSPWTDFLPYLNPLDTVYVESGPEKLTADDYLVIEPNYLVPVTQAVEAITCPRKVYVKNMGADRLEEDRYVTQRITEGNLLHTLLANEIVNERSTPENIELTLQEKRDELILSEMSQQQAREYLYSNGMMLKAFNLDGDTEVDVQHWNYGLHGKIDAITSSNKIIELKSSNIPEKSPWPRHNLQMITYQKMMEDHGDYSGTVLYLKDGQVGMKQTTNWEFAKTIVARNWSYLIHTGKYIPKVLRGSDKKHCRGCYLKSGCHKLCSGLMHQRDCEECYHETTCSKKAWSDNKIVYFNQLTSASIYEENQSKFDEQLATKNLEHEETIRYYATDRISTKERIHQERIGNYFHTIYSHNSPSNRFRKGDYVVVYDKNEVMQVTMFHQGIIVKVNQQEVVIQSLNQLPTEVNILSSSSAPLLRRSRSAVFRAMSQKTTLLQIIISSYSKMVNLPKFDNKHASLQSPLLDYNAVQTQSIINALNTPDLYLIQGPAGTGKTSVIVEIVHQLFLRGKIILATGYTNKSVDNIGDILLRREIPFIRFGSKYSISDELEDYTIANQEKLFRNLSERNGPVVVLATTTSIGSRKFSTFHFDCALVDEAAQMTEADSLIPLVLADRAILVGDHAQLEPIVISQKSKEMDYHVSLFERLVNQLSERHILLNEQYRMNDEILSFPNKMFYRDELKAASNAIATHKFHDFMGDYISSAPYQVLTITSNHKDNQINRTESHLIVGIIKDLLDQIPNLNPRSIGIITPFRAQVSYLRNLLPGFDIDTVDRFQGTQRDIIIFSTITMSDIPILSNPRRINVALTRPAKLLVVLLSEPQQKDVSPFLKNLYQDAVSRNLVYEIPTEQQQKLMDNQTIFDYQKRIFELIDYDV